MEKNWKLNRGRQLNKTNNSDDNDDINTRDDLLINLYKEFLNFNQEINIRRVVDYEFSKIKYIQNSKQKNIKSYFTWKK